MIIEVVVTDERNGAKKQTTRMVNSYAVAIAMLAPLFIQNDPWKTDPMLPIEAHESRWSDGNIRIEVILR